MAEGSSGPLTPARRRRLVAGLNPPLLVPKVAPRPESASRGRRDAGCRWGWRRGGRPGGGRLAGGAAMQPLTERCGWRGVLGTEVETPRARCLKSVKTVCFSSVKTAGHAIRRLCSGFGARSRQGRGRLGGRRVGFKSRQALPGSTGATGATPALSASHCAGALVPAPRPSWSAVSRGHCLRHTLRGGPARRAVTLDGRGLHLGQRVGLSQTCSLSAAVRPDVQAADGALSEPRHWVPRPGPGPGQRHHGWHGEGDSEGSKKWAKK